MDMKLSPPAKKLLQIVSLADFVLVAAGFLLSLTLDVAILPIVSGILILYLVNLAKIFLLDYQVSKLGKMEDPNKARLFAVGQGLLRFVLTAAGLVAAHFLPFEGHHALYAAIAGAFSWNIAVYALKFVKFDEDAAAAESTENKENAEQADE